MDTSCYVYIGVTYCDKLFKIEERIANLSVEEKQKVRQKLENPSDREQLEKYLPWSKDLPNDILNFQSTENENAELLVVSEK